jgi:hypothetical protein
MSPTNLPGWLEACIAGIRHVVSRTQWRSNSHCTVDMLSPLSQCCAAIMPVSPMQGCNRYFVVDGWKGRRIRNWLFKRRCCRECVRHKCRKDGEQKRCQKCAKRQARHAHNDSHDGEDTRVKMKRSTLFRGSNAWACERMACIKGANRKHTSKKPTITITIKHNPTYLPTHLIQPS